jgi:hypothetical protein
VFSHIENRPPTGPGVVGVLLLLSSVFVPENFGMSDPIRLLLFCAGIAVVVNTLASFYRSRKRSVVEAWPSTRATVESGSVSPAGGEGAEAYSAEIAYSYRVSNHYYSGYYAISFKTEHWAWGFVDAMKGKTVQVQYDPSAHEASVLADSAIRAAIPDPSLLYERPRFWFPLRPG